MWGVATAVNLRLGELSRKRVLSQPGGLMRFRGAMQAEADTWEARLVRDIAAARSRDAAQAEVNAALLDLDARLSSNTRTYAACARICVFGALIGAAWLFMEGRGLTVGVVDVFAVGASGVLCVVAAGKEAKRLVRERRREVDGWVERLVGSG